MAGTEPPAFSAGSALVTPKTPRKPSSHSLPSQEDLKAALQAYFGYSSFREGQLPVIQAVLQKRDTAVFWATGAGKSICYQIPPLVLKSTAIVISPLISLMQDQVHKLNGLGIQEATFLGTAQTDPQVEANVLRGHFRLVYTTPEKLLSGFLTQLEAAIRSGRLNLSLIAVDEAHCVSEWGHDFRPEYRRLGTALRQPGNRLSECPILALTATAVPRVQQDIISSLHMTNHPFLDRQSFDRPNLEIAVRRKSSPEALLPYLSKNESTIVYVATKSEVEEVAAFLQRRGQLHVEAYHAGLSTAARTEAHTNFLTGKTVVIVATVAFGMGIDKPDIRRVVHYGPPQTVEAYYQQIGRAGRDGRRAECIMFTTETDFDRYKSEFYVGGLQGEAKAATIRSMDKLKLYAIDAGTCRRKALLDFFDERSPFGTRCGTCDNCKSVAKYGDDAERDFATQGAWVVLYAIDCLDQQGLSNIMKVIGGGLLDSYRYKRRNEAKTAQDRILAAKKMLDKKRPLDYFRNMVGPLQAKGYIQQSSKTASVGGYKRTWTTYSLTQKGYAAVLNPNEPIMLPVPESIRDMEHQERQKMQRQLDKLKKHGIQLERIPKEEIEKGEGKVLQASSKWVNHVEQVRQSGREERVKQLEKLITVLETWRSNTAVLNRMAPAAVLSEDTLLSVAYIAATMAAGQKLEASSLSAAGVRSKEVGSLVQELGKWVDEVQPAPSHGAKPTLEKEDADMIFKGSSTLQPSKAWEYAVYKPNKKTGLASWESSYLRFANGENPQAIAIAPASGKPIQVATVVGHILQGLEHGRPVDIQRLSEFSSKPPTKKEWQKLEGAAMLTDMDVCGDPSTSGKDGGRFTLTEFLRPIMGDSFVGTPYNERSEDDSAKFSYWCQLLKWYMVFKRIGYEPEFAESFVDV